jgi:hypothetical protein
MKVIWKDVKDYEGLYQVNNVGKVKRIYKNGKERILENSFNGRYFQVRLSKNGKGKTFLVHILVAQAFIPNPENKPQVNHKFGIKTQNIVDLDNLYGDTTTIEWATSSENNKHAYDTGLHKKYIGKNHPKARKVIQYDLEGKLIRIWDSVMDVERELKIFNTNICACCRGRRKHQTAGGYIWRYANENHKFL